MNFLGNVLWLIFGGLITAVLYYIAGLLMCCTIIGIPFGVQLFKFGTFSLMPFGHTVTENKNYGGTTIICNIIWVLFGWWEIALTHVVFGALFFITIVGIPFAKQHFKIAVYTLAPFGRSIR